MRDFSALYVRFVPTADSCSAAKIALSSLIGAHDVKAGGDRSAPLSRKSRPAVAQPATGAMLEASRDLPTSLEPS